MFKKIILLISLLVFMISCESDNETIKAGSGVGSDVDGGNNQVSEDANDSDSGFVGLPGQGNTIGIIEEDECDNILKMVIRDFDERHPDFQREDPGWGPLAGVLEPQLGTDSKPVFSSVDGTHTWKHDLDENGRLEKNCWETSPGVEDCYRGTVPMFEGEEYFHDWFNDTEYNIRFERDLVLEEHPTKPGVYYYDTDAFFPLLPTEGWGVTPVNDNQIQQNFLFTTEIHLNFTYFQGQKFTFRGDDDLWIFVNGRLALDLGGLHLPAEGTIDFDYQAEELGIRPNGVYRMSIFHAERRTSGSNFRIETNIGCFVPIIIL